MRWAHVQHHLLADILAGLPILLIAHRSIRRYQTSYWIGIFNFVGGKSHGEGVQLCSRVTSRAQAKRSATSAPRGVISRDVYLPRPSLREPAAVGRRPIASEQ